MGKDSLPVKSDGVATVVVPKSKLAEYLQDLRKVENFVPLSPVTDSTEYVTIVSRGGNTPQYLIQVDYTENEEV